jgi:hypothetical protein
MLTRPAAAPTAPDSAPASAYNPEMNAAALSPLKEILGRWPGAYQPADRALLRLLWLGVFTAAYDFVCMGGIAFAWSYQQTLPAILIGDGICLLVFVAILVSYYRSQHRRAATAAVHD